MISNILHLEKPRNILVQRILKTFFIKLLLTKVEEIMPVVQCSVVRELRQVGDNGDFQLRFFLFGLYASLK